MPHIEASTIIADESGIHWKTIRLTADLVKHVSEHSPGSRGNFNFAATAMLNPYSPFFPGSYHTEEGGQFAIGFECANVVHEIFVRDKGNYDAALGDLTAAFAKQASVADAVGKKVAKETSWNFLGVYLTPGPVGDASIGAAIEAYTGEKFGSGGTLTAVRLITDAIQAVEPSGNSAPMLPVMEDRLLARRWAERTYNIDSLLAYSAVGGMGVDTVPLPGDISVGRLKRIFSDVAALATKGNTSLSARVLPVAGKKPGDTTEFQDPHRFNTTVHPLP